MEHDFWNAVEKVVCVIPFVPAGAEKGMDGRTVAFPHQESRQRNGAAAIIPLPAFGRDKRYIHPRPPSRRSGVNLTACAADRPARPAPFFAPAFPSDGSAPPSPGMGAHPHR